jgi:hypothetical protein
VTGQRQGSLSYLGRSLTTTYRILTVLCAWVQCFVLHYLSRSQCSLSASTPLKAASPYKLCEAPRKWIAVDRGRAVDRGPQLLVDLLLLALI